MNSQNKERGFRLSSGPICLADCSGFFLSGNVSDAGPTLSGGSNRKRCIPGKMKILRDQGKRSALLFFMQAGLIQKLTFPVAAWVFCNRRSINR